MGVNAWLRWALGSQAAAPILGLQAFPKIQTKFFVDFASLLGPIFYTWLLALLQPVIVYSAVYEKANRLRVMMAVHGLSDRAYWSIQFIYWFVLYLVFMIILFVFGIILKLSFFVKTAKIVQVCCGFCCCLLLFLGWWWIGMRLGLCVCVVVGIVCCLVSLYIYQSMSCIIIYQDNPSPVLLCVVWGTHYTHTHTHTHTPPPTNTVGALHSVGSQHGLLFLPLVNVVQKSKDRHHHCVHLRVWCGAAVCTTAQQVCWW